MDDDGNGGMFISTSKSCCSAVSARTHALVFHGYPLYPLPVVLSRNHIKCRYQHNNILVVLPPHGSSAAVHSKHSDMLYEYIPGIIFSKFDGLKQNELIRIQDITIYYSKY